MAILLPGSDFGQVVHTHVPLSTSSIIWYKSQGSDVLGWEGNPRSNATATLAMRHSLWSFIRLRTHGPSKGDKHPTNSPHWVWYTLPVHFTCKMGPIFLKFKLGRDLCTVYLPPSFIILCLIDWKFVVFRNKHRDMAEKNPFYSAKLRWWTATTMFFYRRHPLQLDKL